MMNDFGLPAQSPTTLVTIRVAGDELTFPNRVR